MVIPARGGSKRLPNKNLINLGRTSLLSYSISYALQSFDGSAIYVSTDDSAIRNEAVNFGVQVIDRPFDLASDDTPTVAVLEHAIKEIKENVAHVILLQPTNPLRPNNLLNEAVEIYSNLETPSLFTVSPEIKKLGKIQKNVFIPQNYSPGQRSQEMSPWFYENGLLYIASVETIKSGQIITENSYPLIVDHVFGTVDIDTAMDLDYAEFILDKNKADLTYL